MYKFVSIILLSLIVSNCSKNSTGGYTIGQNTSPAWYSTAPQSDINVYFDKKSTMQLCLMWEENYPNGKTMWRENRIEIGNSLKRRGKDEFFCTDPKKDTQNIKRAKERKKIAEEKKAKYEECIKKEDQCIRDWNSYYSCKRNRLKNSYSCSYPNCNQPRPYLSSCRNLR